MQTPKILLFDIETTPVKAWIWRTGEQYIRHENIVEGERFEIICLAYKWAHEKKITVLDWGREQNSAKMIAKFAKIVESADVVLGQNSDSFDIKQVNTQRLLHGQKPIAWPVAEDLRKQVRKHFYLTSSSLEYMGQLLTGGGKSRMHFKDWVDIVDKKCPKALLKMKKYCALDVKKTQEVWEKVRPFLTPKAHRGIIIEREKTSCPSCGSLDTIKNGFRFTLGAKRQRVACRGCGHVFQIPYKPIS